jgi:ribonuclease HI
MPEGQADEGFGGEANSSNNRMEMTAILQAVLASRAGSRVIVRTDSQLCVLCAVGHWKRKKNLDLWTLLDEAAKDREVVYEWWRGHVGTPGNEAADRLAERGRHSVIV